MTTETAGLQTTRDSQTWRQLRQQAPIDPSDSQTWRPSRQPTVSGTDPPEQQ